MGLLAEAQALRSSLASFDPDDVPAADCGQVAEELAATEKACAVARARAAARAASCDIYRARGFRDPAEWAAQLTGTSVKAADRDLTVAAQLEQLGPAKEAALAGELSLDQVREIALTEKVCPGSEAEMVGLARSSNLTRLRDRGRDLRLNATDVEVLARRQREARDFSHWRDELGMVCGAFRLQPIPGIAFINRLEAEADRLRAEAKKQIAGAEVPEPRGRYVADAFVKVLETGSATGKAVRADVVFVQDVTSGASHLVGGGPVPKSAVGDAVAAGAFVKAVLHDGMDITTVAHYGKSMPAHLRTALELGRPPTFDGVVCEVCGSPFGLEWDHVDPRANGGAWSATNIRPKCWPCHHDKTEADRRAGLLGPGKGGGRPRRSGREPERGPP